MNKQDFNMTNWCQQLLSTDRFPTSISVAMINYVQTGVVDEMIREMGSYKLMEILADSSGLEYDVVALTALRGLAAVPQEGVILVTIFRYLQEVTGKGLTQDHFIEFFSEGMFTVPDMVRIYNLQADDHGDIISLYDWSMFKQECN